MTHLLVELRPGSPVRGRRDRVGRSADSGRNGADRRGDPRDAAAAPVLDRRRDRGRRRGCDRRRQHRLLDRANGRPWRCSSGGGPVAALLGEGPAAGRALLREARRRRRSSSAGSSPFLRVTAAWLAGISHMPWWRFLLWNAAGGIVWATAVGLVAYQFGKAAADAISRYGLYAVVVFVVLGAVVLLGVHLWRSACWRTSERAGSRCFLQLSRRAFRATTDAIEDAFGHPSRGIQHRMERDEADGDGRNAQSLARDARSIRGGARHPRDRRSRCASPTPLDAAPGAVERDPDRWPAARRRQALRAARRCSRKRGAARRRRAGRDPHASRGRREDGQRRAFRFAERFAACCTTTSAGTAPATRTASAGADDPARGADPRGRRRLRRHDLRPSRTASALSRERRRSRGRALLRLAVRSRGRDRVPAGLGHSRPT